MKRRIFIKRTIGAGVVAGLYTWQVEPFWLEFVHQKMPIKNLPKELIGQSGFGAFMASSVQCLT